MGTDSADSIGERASWCVTGTCSARCCRRLLFLSKRTFSGSASRWSLWRSASSALLAALSAAVSIDRNSALFSAFLSSCHSRCSSSSKSLLKTSPSALSYNLLSLSSAFSEIKASLCLSASTVFLKFCSSGFSKILAAICLSNTTVRLSSRSFSVAIL